MVRVKPTPYLGRHFKLGGGPNQRTGGQTKNGGGGGKRGALQGHLKKESQWGLWGEKKQGYEKKKGRKALR